ncbi:CUN022 hypothetical protein [Culex nigripalpus nucleopolyhedrovirus]|uniref:Uncharacterized protein n=1 Tax=Culex nigripalpus nucleopolyhedrovirus (isolate Florida/1997) TaxID=645993 RepID=Q919P7_NPVCO|nr:CUN022 hypothetical protein [Culex nigripalpus nucleopolyhedrovirus]AAK94100.1 CUN022 hypothetical protein [Culex nigripalpus nucleopolyhedrovirus]
MSTLSRFTRLLHTIMEELDPALNSRIFAKLIPAMGGENVTVLYKDIDELIRMARYNAINQSNLELAALSVSEGVAEGRAPTVGGNEKQTASAVQPFAQPRRLNLINRTGWTDDQISLINKTFRNLSDGYMDSHVKLGHVLSGIVVLVETVPKIRNALLETLTSVRVDTGYVKIIVNELAVRGRHALAFNPTEENVIRFLNHLNTLGQQFPMRLTPYYATVAGSSDFKVSAAKYVAETCEKLAQHSKTPARTMVVTFGSLDNSVQPVALGDGFDPHMVIKCVMTSLIVNTVNERSALNLYDTESLCDMFHHRTMKVIPSCNKVPEKRKLEEIQDKKQQLSDANVCNVTPVQSKTVVIEAPEGSQNNCSSKVVSGVKPKKVRTR